MRCRCKTRLEKAWLAASLTALALHHLLGDDPGSDGMWLLEALMIILSFPSGPVAIFFFAVSTDALREFVDVSWLISWLTMLLAGYIQWFWLLPGVRGKNQLTTLNLSAPTEIPAPAGITPPFETASPVRIAPPAPPDDAVTRPEIIAPVVFNAAAFVPPLAEFDEAGLSALDRVLRAHETSTHAPDAAPTPIESLYLPTHSRA